MLPVRPLRTLLLVAVVLAALVASQPLVAVANGQTTHVWITEEALRLLPAGELGDLLASPELRDPLINGAMFPDGGYATGDDYGELAHWEPFQQAYLAWIRGQFSPPYDQGEAAAHVAFLMGMASHGMADENFDSLFMERSRRHDPGWQTENSDLDTASDVLFAARVGGIVAPNPWLPTAQLVELFATELGYEVAAETIEQGHDRLFVALSFVEWARTDEERLAAFAADFPWSEAHLVDAAVPGSPPREAEVVAGYWQDLWQRLHSPELWSDPVLDFVPGDGTTAHPLAAEEVESRLQLSFSRGVDAAGLASVRVVDEQGGEVPVSVHHHYGNYSHAVHVDPEADWQPDTDYQLSIDGPLLNYDGVSWDGAWSASFSTRAPVQQEGCACSAAPGTRRGPWWLLGGLLAACLAARRRRKLD